MGLTIIERVIVWGVSALMLAFIVLTLLTSSFWLRLDGLRIEDACAGEVIPLRYNRTFVRPFHGEWLVSIWVLVDGEWTAWRPASGVWDYKAATPPPDRDLDFLTGGDLAVSRPPPGLYRADVAVTANPGTLFSRTATVESNAFEVRACTS